VTSVCTGAFLIVGAGLARGRRVTTHHLFLEPLRKMGGAEVVEGVRFVRDGNLLTAGGVMSGIEMSLWLVGQLYGTDAVQRTKSYIAYDYPPRDRSEAG
jgi:transcriptional regulator GlxA family with amidase domain